MAQQVDVEAGWYAELIKPAWAPPGWLFGPVWTVLYIIIAVSFCTVALRYFQGRISFMVLLPFLLNLAFNLAFTPIQFGLRNNWLAAIDIALVWITLVWALSVIRAHVPWVTYANLPYLLWVSFASVLQFTITWLNRG
jgi:tryptophan-rich sensory protein